jgi:hypothetical protein
MDNNAKVGCSAAPILMSIGYVSLCHTEGGLYICRAQKPSGPNLLDEP